jgi:hypothetical protein
MRAAIASLLIATAAALARGDAAVGALQAPHTPLGRRCDLAIAAAQEQFLAGPPAVHFHVRERTTVGKYSWSDMCGVWGDYIVELQPDARPAYLWRWRTTHPRIEIAEVRVEGSRRAHGWRAHFLTRGDSLETGHRFIEAFRPAMDVCLEAAGKNSFTSQTNPRQ